MISSRGPLVSLAFISAVVASPTWRPLESRQVANASTSSTVISYNFSMPVDHYNVSDNRTYNNRYWLNDAFYEPGGPVIFYDFGENGVSDGFVDNFLSDVNNVSTAPVELAKRVHGLICGWEHRYYGLSLPVPFNASTPQAGGDYFDSGYPIEGAEGYKYLTVEQALEDVVYFAKNFNPPNYNETLSKNLRPSSTPWIWIGGSYPGSRGAWLRLRNPEVIYAVWASSATVETRIDAGVYFNGVYRAAPQNCSSDIHAVVQYVDGVMSSSDTSLISNIKQRFFASQEFSTTTEHPRVHINVTQADELTPNGIGQIMQVPIQDGFQDLGPSLSTDVFCNFLQSYSPAAQLPSPSPTLGPGNLTAYMQAVLTNPGNNTATAAGVVPKYGLDTALNAFIYASTMTQQSVLELYLAIAKNKTVQNVPPDVIGDQHSWLWQTLTELGVFQGSQPGASDNLISKFVTPASIRSSRIMAEFSVYDPSVFPAEPNVDSPNRYGGWDMRPSNVMFTTGEFDPWRGITVASTEESINAPMRQTVQDIPQCGQPPNGTDVFGVIYPGATHAFDMSSDHLGYDTTVDAPVNVGADLFSRALEQWLPCFSGTPVLVSN